MKQNNLKQKMMSGMMWKFGERFITQGVTFIVSLILARILMPSDYGIVAIINIFIVIADVFLSSGLNVALIQKRDADETDFSTVFFCNFALGVLLYLVLFIAAPFLASTYNMPVLCGAIRVFSLRLPVSSFQSIQIAYVSRELDFKKFFFATITGTLISAVVGVLMAINGFGVWALIAQSMISLIVNTIVLFVFIRWYPKLVFSWDRAKPLISYGSRVMCTDLIGTVFNYLGDFIIGIKYTSSDLAYYTKGKQLPTLLKANMTMTLVSVLFPGMSQINDDKEKVKELSRKSVRILTYLIYPLMTELLILAEPLTILLYTEKWINMVPFIWIVCIEAIISIPGTIALQAIKSVGRSDLMLKAEFIKKPILLLSIICAIKFGVIAIALTLPVNTMIELIVNGMLSQRTLNYKLKELVFDCIPSLVMCIVMGGAIFLCSFIPINGLFLSLCFKIVVGVIVYVALSYIVKNNEFQILFNYLKNGT